MSFNLRNRSLLDLKDFAPRDIRFLIDLAAELKRSKYAGNEHPRLKGKNIALIFEKASTRTRCAFEVVRHTTQARQRVYRAGMETHGEQGLGLRL